MVYLLMLGLVVPLFSSAPYPKPITIEGDVIKVGVMDSRLEGMKPNFPLYFVTVQNGKKRITAFSKKPLSLSLYQKHRQFTVVRQGRKGTFWLVNSPIRVKEKKHGVCKAP